jgi:hypothetical protein
VSTGPDTAPATPPAPGPGGQGQYGQGQYGQGQPSPAQSPAPDAANSPQQPGPGAVGGDPDRGASSYSDVKGQVGGRNLEQLREEIRRAMIDFRAGDITGPVFLNSNVHGFGLSFGHGDKRINARKVPPAELTEPFLRTHAIRSFAAEVSDQAIVVLQGPKGYGKGTALLRTLRASAAANAAVYFLDPATELASFSCDDVPKDSVLVLADLPAQAAGDLDDYTARRIEGELRARDCRLGITTGENARFVASGPGLLVTTLVARPEPRDVFWEHLTEPLQRLRVRRDDVRKWPGVADLLDTQLGADCPLADAQLLATLLGQAAGRPETAVASVRAQMADYIEEKVAQWFRRLPSQQAHCTAIALAVLNGLSRELVAQEAQILEQIISPAPDAPNAPTKGDPWAAGTMVTPAMLAAKVEIETQQRDEGPVVVHAMSYREDGYAGKVLRHVWREYGNGRAALVEWLRALGRSPDLKVRVRAAAAAGELACEAMDFVCSEVIHPWARAKNPDVRDSAAIALIQPAADSRLRSTTRQLVAGWADEDNPWQLRATAARAYGQAIGTSTPTSALRALAQLAEDSVADFDVVAAICNSYCDLVLNGTNALSVRVIGEVERLAADRKRGLQAAGRLTLLGFSTLRGAPSDMDGGGRRLDAWPTLLLLALSNQAIAEPAARLWQLSLADPDFGDAVTASLDAWAKDAEANSELRAALISFLQWIAADPRARQLVLRRAQVWSGRDGKAPRTGQGFLESQR